MALEIAEKLNLPEDIADIHYWIAAKFLDKAENGENTEENCKAALEHVEKALIYKENLLESDYSKVTYALTYSAYIALTHAKDLKKLIGFNATVPSIKKNQEGCILWGQPGYSMGKYRNFILDDIFYQITRISPCLCEEICEGYTFEKETFSYTHTPVKTTFEVVSMDETFQTAARIFEHCLHTRYTNKTSDERNFSMSGVRDIWYAPNVGVVGYHFKSMKDFEKTLKLKEYSVKPAENAGKCGFYLPLEIGNKWSYEAYCADGKAFDKVDYENIFEVLAKKGEGDIAVIAHSGWICEK